MKKVCWLLSLLLFITLLGYSSTTCKPISPLPVQSKLSLFVDSLTAQTVSIIRKNESIVATGTVIRIDLDHQRMDILTNNHVLVELMKDPDKYCFGKAIGPTFPPDLTRIPIWCSESFEPLLWDEATDLAIVKVKLGKDLVKKIREKKIDLRTVTLGPSINKGESIWVLGNTQKFQDTLIQKKVALIAINVPRCKDKVVLTTILDGAILPGASGSGMFNNNGQLVGIIHSYIPMFGPIPAPVGTMAVYIRDIQSIFLAYYKLLLTNH